MTLPQAAILSILTLMLAGFAINRIRFEVVALAGLAAAGLLGIVAPRQIFSGFASPTVITVLEILLIVNVLKRSHLVGMAGEAITRRASGDRAIIVALCALCAALSVFMNNVGALALMIPVALAVCERNGIAPARMMMPLSFSALLGGLCSVIGTPANLIGSAVIDDLRGSPLGFFELAPVGVPLVLAGLVYFWFATPDRPLSPRSQTARTRRHGRLYACELEIGEGSPLCGLSPAELKSSRGVSVHNIVREGRFVFSRKAKMIAPGDILVAEASEETLEQLQAEGHVRIEGLAHAPEEGQRIEAVLLPESVFVGSRIADLDSLYAIGANVEGAGITPRRIEGRLGDIRLAIGDILVLRGDPGALAREAAESGLLILEHRRVPEIAVTRTDWMPPVLFAAGVVGSAVFGVPPEIAFGLVVLALALIGSLSLRRGFEGLNWSILLMLGAMIPLGNAVASTGAAAVLAQGTAGILPIAHPMVLVAAMLALAVLLTPFVNNPSTVLVLAPIGAEMARHYGVPPEPVVIAIVVGASLDFLTPFGHHNNTLVMSVAGYGFADYLRLGAPLVLIGAVVAVAAIGLFLY